MHTSKLLSILVLWVTILWVTILGGTNLQAQWFSCPNSCVTENYGPVVTDIEQHLYFGHPYRDNDKITWVHEGTHGINSLLRENTGVQVSILCVTVHIFSRNLLLLWEKQQQLFQNHCEGVLTIHIASVLNVNGINNPHTFLMSG